MMQLLVILKDFIKNNSFEASFYKYLKFETVSWKLATRVRVGGAETKIIS